MKLYRSKTKESAYFACNESLSCCTCDNSARTDRSLDVSRASCDRNSASDCLEAYEKYTYKEKINKLFNNELTCKSALSRLISASSLRMCSLGTEGLLDSFDELL